MTPPLRWVNFPRKSWVSFNYKSTGVIKKEYDQWRYKSPELDTVKHQQKIVPSQKSSDYLVESLKKSRIRLKTTFLPSKMQKTLLFSASKYLKNSKVFMLLKYFI